MVDISKSAIVEQVQLLQMQLRKFVTI